MILNQTFYFYLEKVTFCTTKLCFCVICLWFVIFVPQVNEYKLFFYFKCRMFTLSLSAWHLYSANVGPPSCGSSLQQMFCVCFNHHQCDDVCFTVTHRSCFVVFRFSTFLSPFSVVQTQWGHRGRFHKVRLWILHKPRPQDKGSLNVTCEKRRSTSDGIFQSPGGQQTWLMHSEGCGGWCLKHRITGIFSAIRQKLI